MSITQQLDESSLSRIYDKTKKYACGAITAFRGENSRAENRNLNKQLLSVLLNKGFSVTKVKGSYIENFNTDSAREVGEESFFVCNYKVEGDDGGELERELVRLGRLYDQDSILSIPFGKAGELIGTSQRSNSFPDYGKRFRVGMPKFGKAMGEFFSRVNGRQFAFESIEEIELPGTINGKWAMKKMAREAEMMIAEKVNKFREKKERRKGQ